MQKSPSDACPRAIAGCSTESTTTGIPGIANLSKENRTTRPNSERLPPSKRRMAVRLRLSALAGSEESATVRQPLLPGVQAARLLATRAFTPASLTIEVL